jgi:hypothetical protein
MFFEGAMTHKPFSRSVGIPRKAPVFIVEAVFYGHIEGFDILDGLIVVYQRTVKNISALLKCLIRIIS